MSERWSQHDFIVGRWAIRRVILIMTSREELRKELQASNAIADVTVEVISTVLFASASVLTSFFVLASIDWRIGLIVAAWTFCFFLLMKFFLPRIKLHSSNRANAQAVATGQIVDTIKYQYCKIIC